MADIYDGSVWKSFLTIDGKYFGIINQCRLVPTICTCSIQCWCHLFSHFELSSSVTIPERKYGTDRCYTWAPRAKFAFLEPLVDDLSKLWKGIEMPTTEGVIHAVLLCNLSDVPATRRVEGFVGHRALKGCSHCLRSFSTSDKAD